MSALAVVMFTLAFEDPVYLVFAIPLVLVFTLGAAINGGDVDDDLGAVGWSSQNMELAVPIGIAGGMVALFLGTLIMKFTPENTASIVPDFSAAGFLATASVIPPVAAIGANIIAQFAVVAPSEEALARVLAPYAGWAIFKSWPIAFIFGAIFWVGLHIPTLIAQGSGSGMYLVLLVLAGVTTGVYIITKNLLAAINTHGTFNVGVIVLGVGINAYAFYAIAAIIAVLAYALCQ